MTATPVRRPAWPAPGDPAGLLPRARAVAPGLAVAVAVAAVATALGRAVPVVGGPVFGIVLGALGAATCLRGPRWRPGASLAGGTVLKGSIVLLGATLSLGRIATVGLGSLPVMLGTLAVALGGAWVFGRLLGVRGDTQTLIGVGTAVCGASAVAAASAVLAPRRSHVAYALATIFTCNVVAVLTFPALGHLLGMSAESFGLWAGTAINDTSSVVAAGYAFGADAGPQAMVVKLTRTLTLVPIVIALALLDARRRARRTAAGPAAPDTTGARRLPWTRLVPPFLLGFLAAATLGSLGLVPEATHPAITAAGTFMITTALAGIGLSLDVRELRAAGARPLVLGLLLWVLVAAASLGLQAATGTL